MCDVTAAARPAGAAACCTLTGGFQLGYFRPAYLKACIATGEYYPKRAQSSKITATDDAVVTALCLLLLVLALQTLGTDVASSG